MEDKKSKPKSRYWAFIAYPESAPEDWKDILQKTGLSFAISPLHDSDKDPTEENKKPHWHIIAAWQNNTTQQAATKVSQSINGVNPISLNSPKGYYRYFTHKDNPDKFQYNEKEIITLNGFNIEDFIELTKSEVRGIKRKIQEFILQNGIIEYSDLMDFMLFEGTAEEYDIASNHTIFFDRYLSSRRNKGIIKPGLKCNPKTGEVIS